MARTRSTMYSLIAGATLMDSVSLRNASTSTGLKIAGSSPVQESACEVSVTLGNSSIASSADSIGIANDQLHEEPVELGLRERIRSFVLDGILGGQHPEGLGKDERLISDGDLPLLHGLEKGTLDLGRGPVDLVGQEYAGDNRAGTDVECACRRSVDLGSRQVGREKIGRELNAAKRQVQRLGKRPDGPRLGQTRYPFDQDVPAGQQGNDQSLEYRALADHQVLKPLDQPLKPCLSGIDRGNCRARDRRWT